MRKKILCLLLACLMTAPALVSCSDKDEKETTPTPSAETPQSSNEETQPEETEPENSRLTVSDDLPDTTFDGKPFRVLTTNGAGYGFDYTTEIYSEDLTGDACNDAVYNRNLGIENRFDTKITCEIHDNPSGYLPTLVQSGISEYEIVGFYDFLSYNAINAKAVMNWLEVPHVNLEKPWHNKLANDSGTINNILYTICSDLSITSMLYTQAFFFNSKLTTQYGYTSETMYDLVKSNQWTLDKAIEIISPMYEDLDGDGKESEDDLYGFGYSIWNAADAWLAAFDQSICKTNQNGVEITFMSDKTVSIVEKLCNWHYNNGCFYNYPKIYQEEEKLSGGKLVFAPLRFKACFDTLRDMQDPYSIIPYPKWDENQAQYLTNADDKFTVFSIPLTMVNDLDFIGTIYEALCAESYKTVYPAYYDSALKGRYSSDPTTAEMVDLIMAGRNFDFSFQFGDTYFQRLPYFVREALQKNDVNIASRYAKIQKVLDKTIKSKLYPLYNIEG